MPLKLPGSLQALMLRESDTDPTDLWQLNSIAGSASGPGSIAIQAAVSQPHDLLAGATDPLEGFAGYAGLSALSVSWIPPDRLAAFLAAAHSGQPQLVTPAELHEAGPHV